MNDLISRADAIDALEELKKKHFDHPVIMRNVMNVIEGLPSAQPEENALHESCTDCPLYDKDRHSCPRFNKVIPETLREVQPEQRWISCSEKMPEEDNCTGSGVQYSDDVLITVINTMDEETVIDYGHTTDGEWYSETTDCFIPHGWKPIAWMPLPEPYEGKEET